jgi:hypothetical protein
VPGCTDCGAAGAGLAKLCKEVATSDACPPRPRIARRLRAHPSGFTTLVAKQPRPRTGPRSKLRASARTMDVSASSPLPAGLCRHGRAASQHSRRAEDRQVGVAKRPASATLGRRPRSRQSTKAVPLPRDRFKEQLIDEDRRQARRQLVDNQNLRIGHQPAGDRKHLLLAARERAGLLPPALLEARKLK